MGTQEGHLIGKHMTSHQKDVFGMGRREGHRQQLHPGRLGRTPGLEVVAAHAGGNDVVPVILAALTGGTHVIPRQMAAGETAAAVHADVVVAVKQGAVRQGRCIVVLKLVQGVMRAVGRDDGVDLQATLAVGS